MKRWLLISVGMISFALGAIGAIIPILPTTPFLLLASYCFARSSERFDRWLRSTKLFQFYAEDYVNTGAIPRKRKWIILTNIYLIMGISVYFAPIVWVKGMLIGLMIFLTVMLFFVIPDQTTEDVNRKLSTNNEKKYAPDKN